MEGLEDENEEGKQGERRERVVSIDLSTKDYFYISTTSVFIYDISFPLSKQPDTLILLTAVPHPFTFQDLL